MSRTQYHSTNSSIACWYRRRASAEVDYLNPLLLSLGTLLTCSASRPREAQLQPAPEFLFQRRPFQSDCAAPLAGYLIGGRHLPFQRKHTQNLTFPLSEVRSLTLAADGSNMIHIAASHRDSWVLDFCAHGEGNTESEALTQLQ
jgi:hypothetical protein